MTATVVGLFCLGLTLVGVAADLLYGPDDSEPRQWPPWEPASSDSSTAQVVESSGQSSEH